MVVSYMSLTKMSFDVNEFEYMTEFVIVLRLIESVICSNPTVSDMLNETSQLSKLMLPEFSMYATAELTAKLPYMCEFVTLMTLLRST